MSNIIEKLENSEYINDINDAFDRIGLLTEMLKIAINALNEITFLLGHSPDIAKGAVGKIEKPMENGSE